jgi:hypothetical protein
VTARLTWRDVCARRLTRHGLAPRFDAESTSVADVAAAICGVHAQVPSAAEMSVAVRLPEVAGTDVKRALWTERSVVKTYGPRGTVHLLPARDLPMWIGALGAIPAPPTSLPESARLTPRQCDEVVDAIAAALSGAELTIDELDKAVVNATGRWAADPVVPAFGDWWPRWRQALVIAARRGVLCFGPTRGRRVTYTEPATWIAGFRPDDAPTAAAELVRRYLHTYGPASPYDFAQWFGAPRAWAVDVFKSIEAELTRAEIVEIPDDPDVAALPVESGAGPSWIIAGDTDVPELDGAVRLLPYFDAYGIGCQPRRLLFPGPAQHRALHRGLAGVRPLLLVEGTVAGIWHHRVARRRITVTVELFGRLNLRHRHELEDEVTRIGATLRGETELTYGTVAVGPHH